MRDLSRTTCFFLTALLAGAALSPAAERAVAPSYLSRHIPDVNEKQVDISTSTCHYKPVFGVGDDETGIVRGVARFGEVTIDPGGACELVTYPREEQAYVVTEGSPMLRYAAGEHSLRVSDYMYLPPIVKHGLSNPSDAPARVLVMGWKIPAGMKITIPDDLQIANIEDVPLEVVGSHPPSTKFRLLMGTTESERDRIAAAHVLTSLFVMEFAPGGTNFPHHHDREEEFYLLMSGRGDMVAGDGGNGVEGRHPARPGDAYFFRLNCTVGFYASEKAGAPTARILAARSRYPTRR